MFMCMDMNNDAAVVDILVEHSVRARRKVTTSRRAFIYSDFFGFPKGRGGGGEKKAIKFSFYDKRNAKNFRSETSTVNYEWKKCVKH